MGQHVATEGWFSAFPIRSFITEKLRELPKYVFFKCSFLKPTLLDGIPEPQSLASKIRDAKCKMTILAVDLLQGQRGTWLVCFFDY